MQQSKEDFINVQSFYYGLTYFWNLISRESHPGNTNFPEIPDLRETTIFQYPVVNNY